MARMISGQGLIGDASGGYVLVAITLSNDSQVKGSHGRYDGWIIKLKDH